MKCHGIYHGINIYETTGLMEYHEFLNSMNALEFHAFTDCHVLWFRWAHLHVRRTEFPMVSMVFHKFYGVP